jgi:hypothetical protein
METPLSLPESGMEYIKSRVQKKGCARLIKMANTHLNTLRKTPKAPNLSFNVHANTLSRHRTPILIGDNQREGSEGSPKFFRGSESVGRSASRRTNNAFSSPVKKMGIKSNFKRH